MSGQSFFRYLSVLLTFVSTAHSKTVSVPRFTLASVRGADGAMVCAGFCRRRRARGGRVALDRVRTPLSALLAALPYSYPHSAEHKRRRNEEVRTHIYTTTSDK